MKKEKPPQGTGTSKEMSNRVFWGSLGEGLGESYKNSVGQIRKHQIPGPGKKKQINSCSIFPLNYHF